MANDERLTTGPTVTTPADEARADANADAVAGTSRAYAAPAIRHLGSVRELTLKTGKFSDLGTKKPLSSTRDAKTDIRYLTGADRKDLADQVLGLKLASYFYKPEINEGPGRHLGFIIEDAPNAPFASPETKTVDLYAFATAIAAVVQEQQATIKRLEDEVTVLRSSVSKKS